MGEWQRARACTTRSSSTTGSIPPEGGKRNNVPEGDKRTIRRWPVGEKPRTLGRIEACGGLDVEPSGDWLACWRGQEVFLYSLEHLETSPLQGVFSRAADPSRPAAPCPRVDRRSGAGHPDRQRLAADRQSSSERASVVVRIERPRPSRARPRGLSNCRGGHARRHGHGFRLGPRIARRRPADAPLPEHKVL